jgi:carbonic anhydrase/acetyltransferase-like protein (isoleucine patch superfamily)
LSADFLSHGFYVACRRSHFFWSTLRGYLRCAWWGIEIGRACRFHGGTYFRRYPGSRMTLGEACTFLSSPNANLIGINRPCMISTMSSEAEVQVGPGCGFSGTVIAAFKQIILGRNVICGANTLITDSDWHPEDPRAGTPAPVIIGNNVWLGVNATILKGVTIGENSVIGAQAVVTSDIPANVIAAGNPCKVIRSLAKEA